MSLTLLTSIIFLHFPHGLISKVERLELVEVACKVKGRTTDFIACTKNASSYNVQIDRVHQDLIVNIKLTNYQ